MARTRRRYVRQMPQIYGNLQKPKRSYEGIIRFLTTLLWAAAASGLVYLVLFSGWLGVRRVEVEGVRFASIEAVRQQVPLGGNMLFIRTSDIRKRILQSRSIQSVAILRGLPDSIKVVVKERQPALLWVTDSVETIIDEEGVAFAEYLTGNPPAPESEIGKAIAPLPKIRDTKNLPLALDQRVVGRTFIQFINKTQEEMAKNLPEATIDRFEIAATTYDVTLVTKQGMRVQLNSLGDAGVQIRNLTRLVHQKKANLNSSVDLRIDRWAYVVQ